MTSPTEPSRPTVLPVLRDPVVIAAFEGWNDAGDAATGAIEQLEVAWEARPLAAIDPDDYYDFQVNRPTVTLADGAARRVHWPTTRLSVCAVPGIDRDAVLIRGLEPNMRWRAFCSELVGMLTELGATTVVTLGALLLDAPHTRAVPVSGTATDDAVAERLSLSPSRYEGPTGIVGVFSEACGEAGFGSVAFWAGVPHYVAQPPNPKATLALLRRLEDLLEVEIPVAELPEQALEWERSVDEVAREDTEISEYVRALEEREPETELPEASGEEIAREFERYLRRRGDGDSP